MKTCFSIMPFAAGFEDIDQIVAEAAEACGLQYVRGDRRDQPGSILSHILHDIRTAAVVVADISGYNPNVFYELGIAHQLQGPDRVVLITQEVDGTKAYDVHQFRQLVYSHNEAGRDKLRRELPGRIRKALESHADQEFWDVIRGRLPRTRLIVRDLQRLVASASPSDLANVTIRVVAGLSSLAISDHEPAEASVDSEYWSQLLAERNALRNALLLGARFKAVLNPPRRFTTAMLPERLRARYRRLLGLFNGHSDIVGDAQAARDDVKAIQQCQFVVTPVSMPNQFIIGSVVAYEGLKRGGTGGFEMTHCESNPESVQEMIEQFDRLFDDCLQEMKRTHPPDGQFATQLRAFYEAAISGEVKEVTVQNRDGAD